MTNTNQTLFHKLSSPEAEQSTKGKEKITNLRQKIFIIVCSILICSFFFIFHFSKDSSDTMHFNVLPGNIWPGQTVQAEYSFPVYKEGYVYQKDKETARKNSLQVFIFDNLAESNSMDFINYLSNKVLAGADFSKELPDIFSDKTSKDFFTDRTDEKIKTFKNAEKIIRKFLLNKYKLNLLDTTKAFIKHSEIIIKLNNNNEKISSQTYLVDLKSYLDDAYDNLKNKVPDKFLTVGLEILQKAYRPNVKYSNFLTEKNKELAEKSVPRTEGFVHDGETIISKSQIVTASNIKKLQSYEFTRYLKSDKIYSIWVITGSVVHAGLIFAILIIYLMIIRKRIFSDNYQLGILCFTVTFVAFLGWLSLEITTKLPIEYFVLIPGLAMLVAIVFDSRTAFYTTVTMAMMLSGIRGNDYDTGTAMMFSGILAAYSVRDIQSRTQMFKSIFFIFIGLLIPVVAFGLERSIDMEQGVSRLVIILLNSALSPLLTFGLLIIIERVSSITTDLKLEEYNNINHPLLVKMNELAPGSYQHTLSMALLSEKCAAAIGANSLLARVGAYFHDIGKIAKPEYFVENQLDFESKHDLISPKKSAEAIKSHVLEGIRLAKEYKLPKRISDFIPMHHGTFLIKHFYAKAWEDAHETGVKVNESEYRYPGPKPNSKETAIVMICDSAEALSRLKINEKDELLAAIDRSIQLRYADGQFDECDLTLKDLNIIKQTCYKNLIGISHQRVEYKEIPNENNNQNEEKLNQIDESGKII